MTDKIEGGCLCGAVRYEITGEPAVVGNCFCVDCRKASGTSHATHAIYPASAFTLRGETRVFSKAADSGHIIARNFCPTCGSDVYSDNSGIADTVAVRVSSMDDPDAVEPKFTVYASRAPSWAMIDRSNPVFDEMPPGGPQSVMN